MRFIGGLRRRWLHEDRGGDLGLLAGSRQSGGRRFVCVVDGRRCRRSEVGRFSRRRRRRGKCTLPSFVLCFMLSYAYKNRSFFCLVVAVHELQSGWIYEIRDCEMSIRVRFIHGVFIPYNWGYWGPGSSWPLIYKDNDPVVHIWSHQSLSI